MTQKDSILPPWSLAPSSMGPRPRFPRSPSKDPPAARKRKPPLAFARRKELKCFSLKRRLQPRRRPGRQKKRAAFFSTPASPNLSVGKTFTLACRANVPFCPSSLSTTSTNVATTTRLVSLLRSSRVFPSHWTHAGLLVQPGGPSQHLLLRLLSVGLSDTLSTTVLTKLSDEPNWADQASRLD
jgi:hypothetical protein